MAEEEDDLPPPYSLIEQSQNPTPRPTVRPKPSTPLTVLSAPVSDAGPQHSRLVVSSSSNTSLPSPVSVQDVPSSTDRKLLAFKVVTKKIKRQLVTLEDIRTHLMLLRAFRLFKEKVEDPYSDSVVSDIVPSVGRGISLKGRWLWFLEMAVERSVSFRVLVRSDPSLCHN